jgi:hypothetical protein
MAALGRIAELWWQWYYFNRKFFGGKLRPPRAIRITSARSYDGYLSFTPGDPEKPVKICISAHMNRYSQTGVLLHEMVHQYQHEVLGMDDLDHGPSFRGMAKAIEKETNFIVRVKRLA